ncbi:hypothetical protein MXE95_13640 [Aeromonas caviae]|uniref:hypothetical protein n=1 Tax=Aeromonas caviae TaxID=648 RepID=UPI002DBCFE47|nr:hypothetical protein [Aeromonas caviae]MEB5775130.1 hypothetical protein [Aeromonas caviae]MEB6649819.1 hypothetical protein [Aeromonas caviae]
MANFTACLFVSAQHQLCDVGHKNIVFLAAGGKLAAVASPLVRMTINASREPKQSKCASMEPSVSSRM